MAVARSWLIQDVIYPPNEVEVISQFEVTDSGESNPPLLNDENIWNLVDAMIGLGLVTQTATVTARVLSYGYALERPEEPEEV